MFFSLISFLAPLGRCQAHRRWAGLGCACGFWHSPKGQGMVWECSPPFCSYTGLTPSWAIMPDRAWEFSEATGEIPPALKQQLHTLCCALNGNPEHTKQFPVLSNPSAFSALYKCTNSSVPSLWCSQDERGHQNSA